MSYLGNSPQTVTTVDYQFIATAGQTVFTGNDSDGKILAFELGNVDVFVNGFLMSSDDYTETTGTITLNDARDASDVVLIRAKGTYSSTDHYTKAEVDAEYLNFSSDLVPDADGTRDLGAPSFEFAEVHARKHFSAGNELIRILDIDAYRDDATYTTSSTTSFAASGCTAINTRTPLTDTSSIKFSSSAVVRHVPSGDDFGVRARLEYFDGANWYGVPNSNLPRPLLVNWTGGSPIMDWDISAGGILTNAQKRLDTGAWLVRWKFSSIYAGVSSMFEASTLITEFEPGA
jgi:hypothetical protein